MKSATDGGVLRRQASVEVKGDEAMAGMEREEERERERGRGRGRER